MIGASEGSTLVRLPPPLRGRGGERGKPRVTAHEMPRRGITKARETIERGASVVRTMRLAIEQAAPLSLTLPRKGGGNPSADASLTEAKAIVRDTSTERGGVR
ncbi:hypothetical protein ACVW1C_005163 [Bradyrhizobium sp. USDA 4011]